MSASALPVTVADVEAAARRIEGAVIRTPSAVSRTLSELLGATVVVKFENLQFVSSYKERGARNRLLQLDAAERAAGVVAFSAGNHAQAVAHHARLLGIPATIVMPEPTPYVKIERRRHLGATVELAGETVDEAMRHCRKLVESGLTFVHPFDDPAVIAGAGTVGLELFEDHDDLDAIVVPVGGGGLLAGISVAARGRAPGVELVGVQSEQYPSMVRSLAGDPTPVPGGPTMAEGIAVSQAGVLTTEIVAAAGADVVVVSDRAVEEAVNHFLEIEKVVSEGAGAAGIAALIEHPGRFAGRRVGVVLTGGNIDPRLLASVIMRNLVRSGRVSRVRVWLDDRPGALSRLTALVGAAHANIVEVAHQRLFGDGPIRYTEIELAVETMDRAHAQEMVAGLCAAGYRAVVAPLDPPPPA